MKRLLFFFLLAIALPAAAQYPNRAVTMLTGYPAGGLVDIVARMVAENMKPRFPAGLVVVNRPGAAGASRRAPRRAPRRAKASRAARC